jgi:non-specific serine/threonine protein kinase
MLETIREYAWEHLAAGAEAEEVRQRHVAYYLELSEQTNAGLGPDKVRGPARLDAEHENLRQALDWCLTGPSAAEDGLRLAVALWRFWLPHGFLSEGRAWLERALAANVEDGPAAARALALAYAGHAAWLQGDAARAVALSEEGLELCRCAGQEHSEAAAYCLRNLVAAAVARGDYARAHALAEESVAVARATDDRRSLAHALFERGRVAFFRGELAAARLAFEESLVAHRELDDRSMVASVLGFLGRVATEQGNYAETHRWHADSLAIKRELGLRRQAAFSLTDLALAARLLGNFAEAQRLYAESLAIFREAGDRPNLVWALEGQAGLLAAIGQAAPAAKLLGAAAALRTAAGLPVPPVERERVAATEAAVRGWLGERDFAAAWGAGQQMSAEHAIAAALQE